MKLLPTQPLQPSHCLSKQREGQLLLSGHVDRCRLLGHLQKEGTFFSSSVADVALMARSLHESKQQKTLYRDARSLKSANRLKQNKETTTTQKATTRKSPSQTCVSPAEKAKQKAGKHQSTKTGPEPKRKHTQNRFALGSSGKSTASLSKACKQKRIMCRSCSGRHEDSARGLTLA